MFLYMCTVITAACLWQHKASSSTTNVAAATKHCSVQWSLGTAAHSTRPPTYTSNSRWLSAKERFHTAWWSPANTITHPVFNQNLTPSYRWEQGEKWTAIILVHHFCKTDFDILLQSTSKSPHVDSSFPVFRQRCDTNPRKRVLHEKLTAR